MDADLRGATSDLLILQNTVGLKEANVLLLVDVQQLKSFQLP